MPADGRLLAAATLEVAEAALTGESLPVSKGVEPVEAPDAPLGDRTDMVYMNTNVTRGPGEFVVTSTGMATEVGHISGMLQRQDESKSPLTVQLEKLTKQLVTIAGLALVASVALNMARGQSFTEVFTVAVAFAIAAIPTGLPGRRDDDPLARHAAARRRQRDRQAAALDRDARRHVGDLLGQDRHADAQPDDRGRADDPRAPLHGLAAPATRPRARSSTSPASRTCRSSSSCSRWRSPATRS